MKTKEITRKVQGVVRDIARRTKCDILDNKRLILNQNPVLYYQPDFVLLKSSSLVIVEIELSTDARKSITGDIVRAGMVGASVFIGITKDSEMAETIEKYGEILTRRISEISPLKVYGLSVTDKNFSDKLIAILQ